MLAFRLRGDWQGGSKAASGRKMALFLSNFTNKVDKKGRVSVPAPFRSAVAGGAFPGVVVYRPVNLPCIEGADFSFIEQLSDQLYNSYGPFNDEQMSVATTILGGSSQLSFDPEGRVTLPVELKEFAGVGEQATFVGIGRKFQIWDPAVFAKHQEEQLAKAVHAAPKIPPFGGGQGQ